MMSSKRVPIAIGFAAMAIGLTGCATVTTDGSAKMTGPTDSLSCTLPTNCVSSLGDTVVRPLSFTGTNADGVARLRATLRSFPEATVQDMTDTTVVAIFTTPAGFKDTVEFRIDSTAHRIDYRSRSGFGLFDFGKNRSRMTEFTKRFAQP